MLEFILASSNPHKAEEFSRLVSGDVFLVKSASEKIEVIEDADTFRGNAFKKASEYYQKYKSPILADDSGLVVSALPDELGVRTARYGGEGLSAKERYELLLKNLENEENRAAYFCCYLCCYLNESEVFYFEGRVNGHIAQKASGIDGFGYDPVFVPEGKDKTFSELIEWKDQNSHRAVATQHAAKFFKEWNCKSAN